MEDERNSAKSEQDLVNYKLLHWEQFSTVVSQHCLEFMMQIRLPSMYRSHLQHRT